MSTPPAWISEADWLATPASGRTLIFAQWQQIQALLQENEELRAELTALAKNVRACGRGSAERIATPPSRQASAQQ